ncbi:MAG: alpha/beta hydrolase [Ekhidna sp.]|uniref:alpha/beta fold hydrolase n=1 Tax=Ekhidna sp. TaxID=2608089 RepID=UPI0032EFBE24
MKKSLLIIVLISACQFRVADEDARESLEDVPIEIRFGDLLVDGRNMHYAYTEQEKDVQLVFIHGSPGSWNAFIDFFKVDSLLRDFDMLSVDRPGFGDSGFGEAEPSLEKQALLIERVLSQFPKKKQILIGHSLGGPVAARMAMDFPEDFDGIILVAPSIDPSLEEEEWYRGAIKTQVGAFFTPKEFEVSNDEILALRGELELMLPLWDKIKVPTIVIQGTEDSLVPKENAAFAKRMISDSLLEVNLLDGVNHFIPWTDPQEITKAIYQLIDGQ